MNEYLEGFKPCPFCGKSDRFGITPKEVFYELQGKHGDACIGMECTRCYTEMYEHTYDVKDYEKRLEILRRKWNKRVTDDDTV